MKLPNVFTVLVRDSQTRLPVENVAIALTLFAVRKNNYFVGPVITDHAGRAEFTKTECEFSIQRSQELFLMDYEGDLDCCRPRMEARLHPHERIEVMLRQYRGHPQFWGKAFRDPERLFQALRSARNRDYADAAVTASEDDLLANPSVLLLVSRK